MGIGGYNIELLKRYSPLNTIYKLIKENDDLNQIIKNMVEYINNREKAYSRICTNHIMNNTCIHINSKYEKSCGECVLNHYRDKLNNKIN